MKKQERNAVFLNEYDSIEIIYIGNQTRESVFKVVEKTINIIKYLEKEHKPVLILSDLSQMGRSDSGSRLAALRALKDIHYDKIALFGANVFIKHLARLIIKASGKGRCVQYFETKKAAENWLYENPKPSTHDQRTVHQ